jgi:hypothetical protein
MLPNGARPPAHRGLLFGSALGGPVVGVDGVSRSAFVFIDCSIYNLHRLLTTLSQHVKRLFVSFRRITAFSLAFGLFHLTAIDLLLQTRQE